MKRFRNLFLLAAAFVLAQTSYGQNALDFDGVDDYVRTPYSGITGSSSRTVEAWVKSTFTSSQTVIMDMGVMSPNGSRFTVNLLSGKLRIEVGGNGKTGAVTVADGNWHHVAIVYDDTQASNKYSMYVDGVMDGTPFDLTVATNTGAGDLFIGNRNDLNSPFVGQIDEVRVWNTVRTQTELTTNSINEFCSTQIGLVAYHKFNAGIASGTNANDTISTDDSGLGNNGVLKGFGLTGATSNWVTGKLAPCALPTCLSASGFGATNITGSSADVYWTQNNSGATIKMEYGVSGFTLGQGIKSTPTNDTVSLTGLLALTTYQVYIKEICSATDSSSWAAFTFTTGCGAVITPFTENFDGITASNSSVNPGMPSCWTYYETPGHPGYGYTYSSLSPNSAPNHMRFYTSSGYGDTLMIISPPIIGLNSSDKEVVFWAKSGSASYNSPVAIGSMTDPSDPSTLTILATVSAPQNYTEFSVPIDASSGYNGTDQYLAVVCIQPTSPIVSLYVDDITVQVQPACPKPALVTLGATTSSSQDVSWTSAGTSFDLEWGPTGFTQGTGQIVTTTTNSYLMTGLGGNTAYDVYIRNNCSSTLNGVSVWQGPVTFKTLCNAVSGTVFEDFESASAGSSTNPSAPDCWTYVKTSYGGSGYGYTYNSASYANSGTKSFRFYTSSNATYGDTMGLVSPEIAGMSTTYKQVGFYARGFYAGSSYEDKLIVGTVASPGDLSSFEPIDTFDVSGSTYQYFLTYLDPANGYNGTHQYIAIIDASDVNDYPMIDDITISDIPSCLPSSSLSVNSVTNGSALVNWVPGDGLAYNVEYGPVGFTQGTGSPLIKGITSSNYTLTGLNGNTCYDVYVRDSCASATSPWFGPVTFCTACDPFATPIMEGFETTSAGSSTNLTVPNCWSYVSAPSTSGYGYVQNSTASIGARRFYMYSLASNADTIALVSPAISGIANGDKRIKFFASSGSATVSMPIIVGTTPSVSDLRNATIMDTIYTQGNTLTREFEVNFDLNSGYNGSDEYIFLMHGNSTSYTTIYLDSISIVDIPACAKPWSLSASNITSSSAVAAWTNINGTGFRLEYGPQGFLPGTGSSNGIVIQNATSPTTISGLMPNTEYDFYVSDNCAPNDLAGPFTFKTLCLAQLSGSYTVGGATSDFTTLADAIFTLNGCGISGPVTFNLQGGTHAAFTIGEVVGASATNTITINGSSNLGDSIVATTEVAAIELNGAKYVTVNGLYIENNTGAFVVWMHESSAHLSFESCTMVGSKTTTSFVNSVFAATNTATSSTSAGNNVSHVSLTNSHIIGGYYGIAINGASSAQKSRGIELKGNTIEDVYYFGLRVYYTDSVIIEGNSIPNGMRNTSSTGIYVYYSDNVQVLANAVYNAKSYGLYFYYSNHTSATPGSYSIIANNMIECSGAYGAYLYYPVNVDVHNNTIKGGTTYGVYLNGSATSTSDVDIRNNIVVNAGTGTALYVSTAPANTTIDYNLYVSGGNIGNGQATLAAWKTATPSWNQNSIETAATEFVSNSDFHLIGGSANDVGDNSVGITVDIDGDIRPALGSTTIDIGADEYTPVNSDVSLISGNLEKGMCLTQNDTILLEIENMLGSVLDFATDNLIAKWDVTGPANSNGTITINTGTLAVGAQLTIMATTVDLSIPGVYTFNAYLEPSSYNLLALNDTLETSTFKVNSVWEVTPVSDTIYLVTDSVDLNVKSSYLKGGTFFFTEIKHFHTTTGAPTGGWPSWYGATDEHVEITGAPGSDLGGYTFEQWNTSGTAPTGSQTFPAGTVLSPDGTAIISMRNVSVSPTNYFYDGSGGNTIDWQSSGGQGIILKDPNGVIVDAAAYGNSSGTYSFPANAGVTSADYSVSGTIAVGTSTCGIRLEGPDLNSSAGWIVSSSANPQNPNTVNNMVAIPNALPTPGFFWSEVVNGALVQIDTMPTITVGASSAGVSYYVASFTNACGTFSDTVTVYSFIAGCPAPTNTGTAANCTDVTVTWTSDAGTTTSYIEYGLAGYAIGTGTPIIGATSPQVISGLTPNTAYDFYLIDSCAAGFTAPIMLTETTANNPTTAAFTWTQSATSMSNADVDFDASTSVNGTAYTWDFGDGSAAGTGVSLTHQYASNGKFYTTVTVDGPCGTDVFGDTVLVMGISIEESLLSRSLNVYPNPNSGAFKVSFDVAGIQEIELAVLNTIGQIVYQENVGTVAGTFTRELAIENLAPGVYFLRVMANGKPTIIKMSVL